MRQLYIFIAQFLFILLCEQIDTAFINNVSLDAICVLSAFHPIMWTMNKFRDMGIEGYKVVRKDRMNCFVVCIISSIFASILCISLSGIIPDLYSLTNIQKSLLHKCFILEGIGLLFQGMEHFIHSWLLLECRNKEAIKYSSIYYVMMIGADAFVYINGFSMEYFMLATTICNLVQVIIYFIFTDFLKKEKITFYNIKVIVKHSVRILWDGLTGKVATLFYNIYASKLGTELYAIHAVCYNICTQEEYISNALYTFSLTHILKFNIKERYEEAKRIIKENIARLILIVYFIAFTLLLLTHGDVPMLNCVFYMLIYVSDIIPLIFYEVFKGYLVCAEKTSIIKNGGLIGILVRIPVVLIGYYSGFGVFTFAIPCLLDFSVRAIYFWLNSKKIDNSVMYSVV